MISIKINDFILGKLIKHVLQELEVCWKLMFPAAV